MRNIRCFLFVFLALSAMAVYATEETTLEHFAFMANAVLADNTHLQLSQDFSYNDNVDEAPRSHRSGTWTTDTNIDAQIVRSRENTSFGLNLGIGYEHDFHKGENDDGNGFSYYLTPIMNGNYSFGRHTMMLGFSSKYENQELDRSLNTTTMVATNRAELGWSTELTGKTVLAFTADYTNEHYSKNKYQKYDNQVYGATFSPYWNATQRTKLGLTAGIERTSYAHNTYHDDFNRYNFGGYATYKVSGRTDLFAEFGGEQVSYQGSSESDRNHDEDYEPYFRVGGNYTALDNLKFRLAFGRSQEDSWSADARGTRTEYSADLSADYRMTGKMNLVNQFSYCYGDEKTADGDFDEYGYGVYLRYAMRENLTFMTGWKIIVEEYDHRDNDNYVQNEFHVGLTWSIK